MPCRALEAFRPCKTLWESHSLQTLSARLSILILHPFPNSVNPGMEQILHFKVSCEHPPPEGPKSGPPEGGCSQPGACLHKRRYSSAKETKNTFRAFRPFRALRAFRAFQVVKVRRPVRLHPRHRTAPIVNFLIVNC